MWNANRPTTDGLRLDGFTPSWVNVKVTAIRPSAADTDDDPVCRHTLDEQRLGDRFACPWYCTARSDGEPICATIHRPAVESRLLGRFRSGSGFGDRWCGHDANVRILGRLLARLTGRQTKTILPAMWFVRDTVRRRTAAA